MVSSWLSLINFRSSFIGNIMDKFVHVNWWALDHHFEMLNITVSFSLNSIYHNPFHISKLILYSTNLLSCYHN